MLRRLRLFAKGNVDVHDSLHSCRLGGELVWNGINAAFRDLSLDVAARVRHETWTRSDALIASAGSVPDALAERALPLGAHPLASQFSRAVFEENCDALVLSIQPDIMSGLLRHREAGFLLYPNQIERWSDDDRRWARSAFAPAPPLDAAASMANLRRIVAAVRAPVLVYNVSPIVPGDSIACYEGLEETLPERIKRFNLALIDLSRETGLHIVDVERIVAEHGARALQLDPTHLTGEGYRLLAHEVVRLLGEIGLLEPA